MLTSSGCTHGLKGPPPRARNMCVCARALTLFVCTCVIVCINVCVCVCVCVCVRTGRIFAAGYVTVENKVCRLARQSNPHFSFHINGPVCVADARAISTKRCGSPSVSHVDSKSTLILFPFQYISLLLYIHILKKKSQFFIFFLSNIVFWSEIY